MVLCYLLCKYQLTSFPLSFQHFLHQLQAKFWILLIVPQSILSACNILRELPNHGQDAVQATADLSENDLKWLAVAQNLRNCVERILSGAYNPSTFCKTFRIQSLPLTCLVEPLVGAAKTYLFEYAIPTFSLCIFNASIANISSLFSSVGTCLPRFPRVYTTSKLK